MLHISVAILKAKYQVITAILNAFVQAVLFKTAFPTGDEWKHYNCLSETSWINSEQSQLHYVCIIFPESSSEIAGTLPQWGKQGHRSNNYPKAVRNLERHETLGIKKAQTELLPSSFTCTSVELCVLPLWILSWGNPSSFLL